MTGAEFKALRQSAGLTQQALSDITGLHIRQIQRLEKGDVSSGDMAAKNLFAIADALNVDPRYLIEKAGVSKRSVESAVYTLNRRETR